MGVGVLTIGTILLAAAIGLAAPQAPSGQGQQSQGAPARGPAGPGLALTTPAFPDGGEIPARFTMADPKAVSPRLEWTNVPAGTVTLNRPRASRRRARHRSVA